ncbi:MAG: RNA methyltransferase [Acidobacteriota bacterium]
MAEAAGSPAWALELRKKGGGERYFFIEGVRFAREAMDASVAIAAAFATTDADDRGLLDELARRGTPVRTVPERMIERLSFTRSPQGVVLVAERPRPSPAPILAARKARLVYLDAVQDPGNAGAIVRAARAFGWNGVVAGAGTADPYSPKSARASASAELFVPIFFDRDRALARDLARAGFAVLGADPRAGELLSSDPAPARCLLVLGSEGAGIGSEMRALVTRAFRIPLLAGDSLNVAQAAAIAMYALALQKPAADPA